MRELRLSHFSEDPSIEVFTPRPVRVASDRGPGRGWLNGPLVWAIDEWHAPMYYFPRDCPRILLWRREGTTAQDLERLWWCPPERRMLAHIEEAWLERLRATRIYRYVLPSDGFEDVGDVGTWVSRRAVTPLTREVIEDLPAALDAAGVELKALPELLPLKGAWDTSLHASGLRLRNARGWSS